MLLASVFPAFVCLLEFCWDLLCSSPVSRAFISEGIFPWSIAMHHCLYISSSSLRAHMALSRLDTNSSKYWYLSFFLARHSLALWRLLSSFAFRSILAGLRPRLPGFFTLPPTTLLSSISADRPAWPGAPSPCPPPAQPAWPGPAPAPGEEGDMVLTVSSSRLTVRFPDATVTGTRDQFRNDRADPGGGPKRLLSPPPPPPPPPWP